MCKWVLTAACVFVAAGTAFGVLGEILATWGVPGFGTDRTCAGLARNNGVFYICNDRLGLIIRATGGRIIGTYPASGGMYASGLAYQSGGYLWQNQGLLPVYYVYRRNAVNGSVYNYYNLPYSRYTTGTAPLATGDGGEGTSYIILSNYDTRTIYYMTTTGSIARSHSVSQPLFDIAYDWRNRLIWGGRVAGMCYGYNTNGSLVASFNTPAREIRGVTYHSATLYISEYNRNIYLVHCPAFVGVGPASMGKIKAIYR